MRRYFPLTMMSLLALGLSACDDKTKTKTETTEKSVVNGTTVESKTATETVIDEEGRRSQETKSKTTVDPEGPMNKETREETRTQEVQ